MRLSESMAQMAVTVEVYEGLGKPDVLKQRVQLELRSRSTTSFSTE